MKNNLKSIVFLMLLTCMAGHAGAQKRPFKTVKRPKMKVETTQTIDTAHFFTNPVLWTDVPDPDVIRVGDDFYMVTTTMHLMPGAPIMHSRDLVNWKTIGYIFDRLTDSPRYDMQDGTVYGRGQWATSLKYHGGKFYALFSPNDNPGGDTYIYSATQPEGKWTLVSRLPHFHDASLFFDDDGRAYVIYATGELCELTSDLKGVKEGSHAKLFERDKEENGLLEGSRMVKHNGQYYLLMISWIAGHPRREVCYRASNIHGPYEKRVILETDFDGFGGVGQGTIIDTKDGRWYGLIFQDRGGIGRVLTLEDCQWSDGWPMLGDEQGRVPKVMRKPIQGYPATSIVSSDDFNGRMSLDWQWNHNPIDTAWTLTERPGWLRLKTSRIVDDLYEAPNTLSQRLMGPVSDGYVRIDVSHMKPGDRAGIAAFNGDSGVLTVYCADKTKHLMLTDESVQLSEDTKTVTGIDCKFVLKEPIPVKSNIIYLRMTADFVKGRDTARFFYSFDGRRWQPVGGNYKMRFDYRRFFMGTRFAIFNYATEEKGGWVDIDAYRMR